MIQKIKEAIGIKPYYENENGALYCGDCLDILPKIPSESIDLVLTDPPYGIDYLSSWTDNHIKIKNDDFKSWSDSLPLWLNYFKNILSNNGCCCCCCGGGGKTPVTALFTIEFIKFFNLIQTIIWDKKTIGVGWKYRPSYETIVVGSKNKDKYNWFTNKTDVSNIIKINNIIPQANDHPTIKPVSLMAKFIEYHTQKDHIVLDPFLGSGTTAVACESLGRKWIGIELSEKYCEIAKQRIHDCSLNLF